jgi:predicted MFS family arabinose efflux permease
MSASTQGAAFAGPAIGGAVVAAAGSATGFWLDALSFAVSALTLWRLGSSTWFSGATPSPAAARKPERLLAFIRRELVIPAVMVINIAANLGSAGAEFVALPVFARQDLRAGAGGYGALVASLGAGALAGALLASRLGARRRPAVAAGLVFLVQAPLIAGLRWAPGLVAAAAMLTAWGALNMWANVTTQTAFQGVDAASAAGTA